MANDENKRAAAGILANLSGFIISAGLAMLAIQGGLVAFVLGNRIVGTTYYVLTVLAFISFVISIVAGGWSITRTAEQLSRDQWTLSVGGGLFNAQAGLAALGLALFLTSCFFATSPVETETQKTLASLQASIQALTQSNSQRDEQLKTLNDKISSMQTTQKSSSSKGPKKRRTPHNKPGDKKKLLQA